MSRYVVLMSWIFDESWWCRDRRAWSRPTGMETATMAISGGVRLPIEHDYVFPQGALVMGVEPVMKFQTSDDKARGKAPEQDTDKETGLRVWAVTVIDPSAERKADKVITVKIAAAQQPVPPQAIPGTDIRPAIFEGLTVTPWIDDKGSRPRQAYSLRAKGINPATTGGSAGGSKTAVKAA
jgi:hypothetical protein